VDVAPPSTTAACHDEPRVGLEQLAEPFALRMRSHDGAGWDADDDVLRVLAVGLAPHAPAAGSGAEVDLAFEVPERRHAGLDNEADRAATATVAAVGPAAWNVRLPTKRGGAIAARPTRHEDAGSISEHGPEHSNGPHGRVPGREVVAWCGCGVEG
jgi:hypothetical protein